MTHQKFYISQKAFIQHEDKLLVLTNTLGQIDFPGGRVDETDNNLKEALKREVREELGVEIEVLGPFTAWNDVIQSGENLGEKLINIGWNCRLIEGQEIKLSQEHNQYLWVDAIDFQQLNQSDQYFAHIERFFSQY